MTNEPLKRRIAELQPLLEKVIDQKIYIRLSAELGLTLHHGCGGFVAGSLSELIKEKLPDRFDGDRAVIILNEEQFSLEFDDADEQSLRAIICHEAGHVLDLWCKELPVYHIDAATLSGIVQKQIALPPLNWHGNHVPAWHGHESKYIRSLCHIIHRMESIGLPVDSWMCFQSDLYQLDLLNCHIENLRPELASRQGEPITQIL